MRYVVRRILAGLVLLFLISILTFALSEMAPGDFLSSLELDPQISREALEALRQRYGLDRGVVERYLAWLGSAFAGELGYSLAYRISVAELLLPRLRNTLVLTVSASVLTWTLALTLGTLMAWREGGVLDRTGQLLSAVLLAIPQLLLGLGCLFLAAWSGLFPLGGMTSLNYEELSFPARLRDLTWHLVLPASALALTALPTLLRHVRAALLEALAAPFVRHARGHGIPSARLLYFYALPAALNPLISLFGFSVAALASESLLIEYILGWPGLGPLLIEAILERDLHVVVGATLFSAALVILGQLLADLLLYAADPRIREAI